MYLTIIKMLFNLENKEDRELVYELLSISDLHLILPLEDFLDFCKQKPLNELTQICVTLRDTIPTLPEESKSYFTSLYHGLCEYRSTLTSRDLPQPRINLDIIYTFHFTDHSTWSGNLIQLRHHFANHLCYEHFIRAAKHAQGSRGVIHNVSNKHPEFADIVVSYYAVIEGPTTVSPQN